MLYLSRRLPLNLHTTIYDLFAHLKCIAGTIANETLISIDSPKLSIFGTFLHFEEREKTISQLYAGERSNEMVIQSWLLL